MRMAEKNFKISKLAKMLEGRFPSILFAYLFGSSSDGVIRPGSDLDIGLVHNFKDPCDLLKVSVAVGQLISGVDIDIVDIRKAHVVLVHEIMHGKLLFIRPDAKSMFQEFFVRHCQEYEETMYWMKKQLEYRGYEIQWDS